MWYGPVALLLTLLWRARPRLSPQQLSREDTVISRVSDIRIIQAQRHGMIVGLPREDAYHIAMTADLLTVCTDWTDVHFGFPGLARHSGRTWRIPVDQRWNMLFEWIPGFGAVNIRLQ